jgi:hypothetical protein
MCTAGGADAAADGTLDGGPSSEPEPPPIGTGPNGARVVLYGGRNNQNFLLADTWQWDGLTWSEMTLAPSGPAYRTELAMATLNG